MNLRTFLTIIKPKIKTNGKRAGLPIHHIETVAGLKLSIKALIAAGLKIWFLFIANRYFEAIAIIPARIGTYISAVDEDGINKKNKIKAVICHDSGLEGARNSFEKIKLVR